MPFEQSPDKVIEMLWNVLEFPDGSYGEPAITAATNLIKKMADELAEFKKPPTTTATEQGLYEKYLVIRRSDFEIEKDAFVLLPKKDLTARRAIEIYIKYTDNPVLASDLERWLDQILEDLWHDEVIGSLPPVEGEVKRTDYKAGLEALKRRLKMDMKSNSEGRAYSETNAIDVLSSIYYDVDTILKDPGAFIQDVEEFELEEAERNEK